MFTCSNNKFQSHHVPSSFYSSNKEPLDTRNDDERRIIKEAKFYYWYLNRSWRVVRRYGAGYNNIIIRIWIPWQAGSFTISYKRPNWRAQVLKSYTSRWMLHSRSVYLACVSHNWLSIIPRSVLGIPPTLLWPIFNPAAVAGFTITRDTIKYLEIDTVPFNTVAFAVLLPNSSSSAVVVVTKHIQCWWWYTRKVEFQRLVLFWLKTKL